MIFEDIKAAITDWLGKDDNQLTDTVRGQLINMAQRDLLRKYDTRFGEYTHSLDTVASTPSYSVPDGYSRTHSIWFMDGATRVDLVPLTKEEFDTRFESNLDEDTPGYYTLWQNKLILGPCPDAAYSLYWNVWRMLPDLSNGSPTNTNDVTVFAWEYLLFKSLFMATKYLVEDSRAALWEAEAVRYEAAIVREHARERSVHRRPVTNEPG